MTVITSWVEQGSGEMKIQKHLELSAFTPFWPRLWVSSNITRMVTLLESCAAVTGGGVGGGWGRIAP